MNPLPRRVSEVVKVAALIGLIPVFIMTACAPYIILAIVALCIPYMSVVFAVSLSITLLWFCRGELPVNPFHTVVVGLTTGIFPLICAVSYPAFPSLKESGGYIEVVMRNLESLVTGAVILVFIAGVIYFVNKVLNHLMITKEPLIETGVSST